MPRPPREGGNGGNAYFSRLLYWQRVNMVGGGRIRVLVISDAEWRVEILGSRSVSLRTRPGVEHSRAPGEEHNGKRLRCGRTDVE